MPVFQPAPVMAAPRAGGYQHELSQFPAFAGVCRHFLANRCTMGAECRFRHELPQPPHNICRHYLQGRCTFIEGCRFSHDWPGPGMISPMVAMQCGLPSPAASPVGSFVAAAPVAAYRPAPIASFARAPVSYAPPAATPFTSFVKGAAKGGMTGMAKGCAKGAAKGMAKGCAKGVAKGHFLKGAAAGGFMQRPQPAAGGLAAGGGSVCRHFLVGRCTAGAECRFMHPAPPEQAGKPTCRHFLKGTCTYGDACTFPHNTGGSARFSPY